MDANLPIAIVAAVAAVVVVAALLVVAVTLRGRHRDDATPALLETAQRLSDNQIALAGRLDELGKQQAAAQNHLGERMQAQERALTRTLEARLADLTRRVGESLQKQTTQHADTMGDLKTRLAIIAKAQENISALSQQVVSLQDVLANKQARGAFGETQMNDQIRLALPPSAYKFQAKLGNGKVADCLLQLPNPPGAIVVDAKFPLESYHALRRAKTEAERIAARRAFGTDIMKHVRDIAERYIVAGETSDSALMFLPSEAVYAELHAELPEVVEKSHRARVYIVSPTTLMATLNTIRAVLKDAQMREQAGVIQQEVRLMAEDVGRLDDRVAKLQRHFGQAEDDMRQIRISTEKIAKRADRIDDVDLADAAEIEAEPVPAELPPPKDAREDA